MDKYFVTLGYRPR